MRKNLITIYRLLTQHGWTFSSGAYFGGTKCCMLRKGRRLISIKELDGNNYATARVISK